MKLYLTECKSIGIRKLNFRKTVSVNFT